MTSSSRSDLSLSGASALSETRRRRLLVASAVAALAAAYLAKHGWNSSVPAVVALLVVLGVATEIDLVERRVPNRLVAIATPALVGLFSIAALAGHEGSVWEAFAGGAILFVVFLMGHLFSPANLGAGDVKISFLMGFAVCWFGLEQLVIFMVYVFIGLLVVAGMRALVARARLAGTRIPFVPLLSLATALTMIVTS